MAETLWSGRELEEIFGAADGGAMPEGVAGISIDSRSLRPGELFFAI